ncbi:DUF1302 domain-containing protein [Pseudomonas schmalbachii]|uniref:DUF1302 domain-containing protein n=1 Tax=Pseudomonas schmalbachii TaxID=2816993 RepID=A0ABS3TSM0_9PSED|nr:DUF1302 domain-containing protein [Pseudomonas schmalbachii]MBO3275655.1 DUF1302 domain-containing protein [Pseudomonas schmalbachii]
MTRTMMRAAFQPHLLSAAVALGLSAQASAIDFNIGEIEGKFDSSLSVGASWSVRSADPDYIGAANTMGKRGRGAATVDDGRLNFKKGETFSKIFKGIHDLELKYGESGAFIRGKYWYDFELKDEHRLFYDIDDSGREDLAKSSGAEFLDAFVYHNYNLGELPGNARFGKQVVSWGESTFIQNGINVINPIDVAALRRPGAEVKEGLIPVNMFYLSQGLSENITAEAFYQLQWEKTIVDNCGTFFGTDAVAQGCNDRLVAAGPDLAPGISPNTGLPVLAGRAQPFSSNAYFPRLEDNEAPDSGQYGLAMRWFVPELNDTEFGAYYMNYHSRNPYINMIARDASLPTTGSAQVDPIRQSRYFIDYPEDIRLYGLSFQTNLGGTSVGGEVSYRPNMPLQLSSPDFIAAAVNGTGPLITTGGATFVPGQEMTAYKRMPVLQAQMTATQFFDQIWGADRLTVVGEVGYNRINGLGDTDGSDLRFGRSPVFGAGPSSTCTPNPATNAKCSAHGFYTTDSWGYRARAKLDYSNVFAGINLSPSLAWSHDVDGWGPNFDEGSKAISVGIDADYLTTYTASLSYTDFFGGDFSTNGDRDFVALSFGVNF